MPSLAAAFITLALAEPDVATAKPPPKPSEHHWRLHADISPVRMFSRSNEVFTSRSWLLAIPGSFSIGFGHTLGRHVMLGTRVAADLHRFSSDGQLGGEPWRHHEVGGGGMLLPYVEVRPLPDWRVQPFGLVEGGVGASGTRRRSEVGPAAEPHRATSIAASVGGRVGLHAFVLPRLSIDADLGVRRRWSFDWRASPAIDPSDVENRPLDLQVAATVGLSGWW
jgi:hypothetical protein